MGIPLFQGWFCQRSASYQGRAFLHNVRQITPSRNLLLTLVSSLTCILQKGERHAHPLEARAEGNYELHPRELLSQNPFQEVHDSIVCPNVDYDDPPRFIQMWWPYPIHLRRADWHTAR